MKTSKILISLGVIALGAMSMATVKGSTAVSETCFNTLTGNAPNKRITNNNLVVAWGRSNDCLYFTPTSFQAALDSPFKLGRLCWTNGKDKYEVNSSFNVKLNVGVKIPNTPANLGTKVFSMDISHTDLKGGQDTTTLPTSFVPQSMTVGQTVYTLKVLGFRPSANANNVGTWQTPEGTTNCLDLYGELEASPVPEPATMATLGLGALALIRRRRNAKK
jgi:hypothetical protein